MIIKNVKTWICEVCVLGNWRKYSLKLAKSLQKLEQELYSPLEWIYTLWPVVVCISGYSPLSVFVVAMRVSQQVFIWKSSWIIRLTLHAVDAELYISIQWQITHRLLMRAFQWIYGWYRNHYRYPEGFSFEIFRVHVWNALSKKQ